MVTGGSWQPLSARHGGTPIDQTWKEGIPPWISQAVRDWLYDRLCYETGVVRRLFARLHHHYGGKKELDLLTALASLNESDGLDWLDGILHITAEDGDGDDNAYRSPAEYAADLDVILREGHSIWKVSDAGDALERRQDPTVTAAAHQATETARSKGIPAAADHLQTAWAAIYGLHPNPSNAFREAILAVEAVAVPVIVPNQADATLGHVFGQLRRQSHLYELAIIDKTTGSPASVAPVTELVGLLWQGQTDRHEGNIPAIPITQEAAEIAVHATATLVHWFASGAVRRK